MAKKSKKVGKKGDRVSRPPVAPLNANVLLTSAFMQSLTRGLATSAASQGILHRTTNCFGS